ncbi:MAG: ABC transporter permease, partial [Eubacteriales bacterium]
MKRYYKHIKPYWIYFVLSPLLMLIEVFCDVMIPTLAAEIINVGVANSSEKEIMFLAGQMVLFVALAVSTGVGASFCATRASVNFSSDVREELFAKIQEFSFANIDKFSTGSLITRLTNDITQLQQFVVMCLRMAFRAPGMLVGAIFMSYRISRSLSVVYIMLVPILALIIYITIHLAYHKFNFLQEKIDGLNSKVQEMLTNIRVIKALTRENYEEKNFVDVNNELKDSGLHAYRITILQTPLMTLVINAATILVLWL